MFHFWFNTFFVAVGRDKHTVSLKSTTDAHGRTLRSATTSISASTRLNYTAVLPVRPTQTTASSSRLHKGPSSTEQSQSRSVDKVVKSDIVRTLSGTSSASSSTRGGSGSSVSVRRPSQQRDTASVRPRSMHLTGTLPVSGPMSERRDSTSSAKVGQTGKTPRDTLQTTSASQRPRPLHSQEPKPSSSHTAQANGRIKPEDRKTPSGESSARSGIPGGSKVVRQRQLLGRSDSAKLSRVKGETTARTVRNGTLHSKENTETTEERVEPSDAAAGMTSASSTPDLHRAVDKDSPSTTSRSLRQPSSTTKAPLSGVPRYIQRDLANRHVPTTDKTSASQRTFTRQSSARGLVSPSVQARSEGIPSDTVVPLTRYTQHKSQQHAAAVNHVMPNRQSPAAAAAELQSKSKPVIEVSGSSSSSSSSSPTTFFTLTLTKSEIDKANKDVQHKVYSSDFKVCDHFTLCCCRTRAVNYLCWVCVFLSWISKKLYRF